MPNYTERSGNSWHRMDEAKLAGREWGGGERETARERRDETLKL